MEEIAQRSSAMRVQPATTAMLGRIVDHVAALAQGCQLVESAVAWIVMEMRAGQHHFGPFASCKDVPGRASHAPPLRTPPVEPIRIPPPAISEMKDTLAMRSPTMLANAPCPFETDEARDMLPVDRVKKDMLGADRHQTATHAAIKDSLSRPLAKIIRDDVDQVSPMLKQKLPCEGIDRELRLHRHSEKSAKKARL